MLNEHAQNPEGGKKSAGQISIIKIAAAALIVLVPAVLFFSYSNNKENERKAYNQRLLAEFKEEYTPEVKSIIGAASAEDTILQLRAMIKEEEEALDAAKRAQSAYFDNLPEEIKQIHFTDNYEAYRFFYSAVQKIMYDLENDPSLDAKSRHKEFEAVRYYVTLYNHHAQIDYLRKLIDDIQRQN